ncbi:hypothetical protein JAAARDRAFT_166540 [Jaapia argillacea MUCL 33604]|uniref:Zn-dependent exopeptidase n=1 Tax=Jaapia argillacea MUCL 33604 TaxID=933084 RepID=A0A067QLJ0_9AGAM|nr:hypothetical protein JAAARDRAFT_166540 [Jaapia argillacea MUCL 33604]
MDEPKQPYPPEKGALPVPSTSPAQPKPHVLLRRIGTCVLLALTLVAFHKSWDRATVHNDVEHPWALDDHTHGHGKPLYGKAAEDLFLSIPDAASARATSRLFASKPHLAGSSQDLITAKAVLSHLTSSLSIPASPSLPLYAAGSPASRNATLSIPHLTHPTAWIDEYYPVMNTPLDRSLEIISEDGEVVWKAELEEVVPGGGEDADAEKYAEAVPAFHGLSRGGEAEGRLVYAHYGRKEDYDELEAKGVDLNGSIVITRYGGIFRGLKVKGAQDRGAAAVLIYSDPRDDGTVTVKNGYKPYPFGPARSPHSLQRGSVQFLSLYPGDPTTPGYPAYPNATRTSGSNIPDIPSIPISWANAEVLLKEEGTGKKIRLVNHVDDKVTPIWNTMGVIPGHIRDEVVVVGNHRDAQVLGATDPTSGTASLHEVIQALGILSQKGWKPLRTILIASWDAEEYGLIGSTEWGEDFPEFIDKHVVAYLNLDSSVSGSRFHASASPSLAHLSRSTAELIPHPTVPGKTLWDASNDRGPLFGALNEGGEGNLTDLVDAEVLKMYEEEERERKLAAGGLGVTPLGSGSDYTVFLQRIGVASGNEGFTSTLSDPVYHYHSVFDSQRWQETYADPGFVKHVAIAKHLGLQLLRISDSIILPLNTTHYTYELEAYLDKVADLITTSSLDVNLSPLRKSIHSLQKSSVKLDHAKSKAEADLKKALKKWRKKKGKKLRKKLRKIICRIKKRLGMKCHKKGKKGDALDLEKEGHCEKGRLEGVPMVGEKVFPGMVKPRIGRYPAWLKEQQAKSAPHHPHIPPPVRHAFARVQKINAALVSFERGLISKEGIKDREWYKHLGVAPGKWLGYGATTLPGLTEAITFERNGTLAEAEAKRLEDLIWKLAKRLDV